LTWQPYERRKSGDGSDALLPTPPGHLGATIQLTEHLLWLARADEVPGYPSAG
jgi:hypothetical protein